MRDVVLADVGVVVDFESRSRIDLTDQPYAKIGGVATEHERTNRPIATALARARMARRLREVIG